MTLNEKIKHLLSEKNLSPSHFADEIGVQRSSISHILAGRNRPSLDIVQKIVRRFPDLDLKWILDDQISTDTPSGLTDTESARITSSKAGYRSHQTALEWDETSIAGNDTVQPNLDAFPPKHKNIERIVVFYSDGTFREYTASS